MTPNHREPAPAHLSGRSREFWVQVVEMYALDEPPARALLQLACEALDRVDEARAVLARDGLTVLDKYGQCKPHPAVSIERQSSIAAARFLRELRVVDPVPEPRPARLA